MEVMEVMGIPLEERIFKCCGCKEEKIWPQFTQARSKKNRIASYCKKCTRENMANYRQKKCKINEQEMLLSIGLKRCIRCKEVKVFDNFVKNCKTKYGLATYCTHCSESKDLYDSSPMVYNLEEILGKVKMRKKRGVTLAQQLENDELIKNKLKRCYKCDSIKSFDCFHKTKSKKSGCVSYCKDCVKAKPPESFKCIMCNQEKKIIFFKVIRQSCGKYQGFNTRCLDCTSAYQEENKIIFRERLKKRLSWDITNALKHRTTDTLDKPASKYLPYSARELRNHLEKNFLPGMNWENRGKGHNKWVIDHILPICSFGYRSEEDSSFKACWALSNLRPLWEIDNLKKIGEDVKLSVYRKK